MSNDIREYNSMNLEDDYSDKMNLTSFMGGEKGNCIQFTIGNKYCALSQKQIEDLITVLKNRLECVKGYSATDNEMDDIVISP